MKIKDYYKNQDIRARIVEYLGGASLQGATCVYLTTSDSGGWHSNIKPPAQLNFFLNNGLEVARSLWDRNALLVHLDIEYVNFDYPAEPYLNPLRAFAVQQPVVDAVERILLQFGIAPLHLLSGRGHHFIWQIDRDSQTFDKIAEIGHLPGHMKKFYSELNQPRGEKIDATLGTAFAGLGFIMEYLTFLVHAEANPECEIPVEIADVAPGPQKHGREIVSLDITEYGDPLNTRMIRAPFAAYLKPWKKGGVLHEAIKDEIPVMFPIPLHEMDTNQGLVVMRDAEEVIKLAGKASVQIPDQTEATEELITSYLTSDLARFHDFFYSQQHHSPEKWQQTYDRTPLDVLPPCVRQIIEYPNDLLQKPIGIRQVVRTMLSLGWHPRHIAGLIRSKYERDFGWGNEWFIYDAATRADFYTRTFSGLIAIEQDDLIDFNCLSTKEKKFCFKPDYSCNLEEFQNSLLTRRKNERLASRPFNRLFLQEEHI